MTEKEHEHQTSEQTGENSGISKNPEENSKKGPSSGDMPKHDQVGAEEAAFEEKLKVLMNQYIRLQADFDNFRRRTREEAARAQSSVTMAVLKEFLPVLDNFDLALLQMENDTSGASYVKGFQMLQKQMMKVFNDFGVTEIKAEGCAFDPHFHEAVMQVPSEKQENDTVAMVLQKGYMMKDQVLRPAKVQVVHND